VVRTGLFAVAVSIAMQAVAASAPAQPETAFRPGRLVAVEGERRLYLYCVGSGSPTILFESGYGDGDSSWRYVRPRLSAAHRVCVYDRAGMGSSDAPSRPATAPNIVEDLHRLVDRAQIKTPFVLVAHSRGGVYAVLYTLTRPKDVAGMVLIDPSFAEQDVETAAISKTEADFITDLLGKQRERLTRCEGLAAAKQIKPNHPQDCWHFSPTADAEDSAEVGREAVRPEYFAALRSEFEGVMARTGYEAITDRAKAGAHPFGSLPLVVLTRGKPYQQGGPSAADDAASSAVWAKGHDRLAGYSTRGRSLTVPGTGHYIQEDKPEAVVQAIEAVLPPSP
jgi:pimeloyl-ACP methyl ester carboxylesterase